VRPYLKKTTKKRYKSILLSIRMSQQCQGFIRWEETGGRETFLEAMVTVKLEKCRCELSHDIEDNDEGVDLKLT
jgi:hypothetical protein